MKPKHQPAIDRRDVFRIVEEFLLCRPGYLPDWHPSKDRGTGAALIWIFARYLETILQRMNQAPEKNKLAFLDLMGIELIPAQAARAAVVFRMADDAFDGRVPVGTRLVAPPPPESTEQIVFETQRAAGLASAKLKQVISLWPGRDQYIDHSTEFLAGKPFILFEKANLKNTPHHIYVAHDTLLALAGKVTLDVKFELTQPGSEHLDIIWEYWDGKVWRGFKSMQPSCMEEDEVRLDGTNGLTRSGRYRLESDCAKAEKIVVNDLEAYWIRGRLNEPLPLESNKFLPTVDNIGLQITQTSPERVKKQIRLLKDDSNIVTIQGTIKTGQGKPLPDLNVRLFNIAGNQLGKVTTDVNGKYRLQNVASNFAGIVIIRTAFEHFHMVHRLTLSAGETLQLDVIFDLGFQPDIAFANEASLDLSKSFYAYGLQPVPGSAFYFTCEEVFSKPGAMVRIEVFKANSPQDQLNITTTSSGTPGSQTEDLAHEVVWEYWNGGEWKVLLAPVKEVEHPINLNKSGTVEFSVPQDMVPIEVNDREANWIRVRLVDGGFGFKKTVTWQSGETNDFTYVITQAPVLSNLGLSYGWQYGPFHPERVLIYDDFLYEDCSEEATLPGRTFQPFKPLTGITPSLYLGFDKKLPVDRLNLYFDILEQRGETEGPALLWEYWNGFNWKKLSSVEDETSRLRIPGLLSFIGPEDGDALIRFGESSHWLRARLKEDGPPGEPTLNGIFLNAVWAIQQQTIHDDPIGASNGNLNQVFTFRHIPVLEGERIEVRELSGARANVEWRLVAMQLFNGDARIVEDLEDRLGTEGNQTEIIEGDLRLLRDRNKRVTEVWVRWEDKPHFLLSQLNDRHYVLEQARGRLYFGDGIQGKIPPISATILAKKYVTGGGLSGNVPANSINQMQAAIGGVESVFNPKPAEGGADAETPERISKRGPRTIRHRDRALTPGDYETMAKEASAAVAMARVIPTLDPNGRKRAGYVTVLIIPHSKEPLPWPSFGLREQVRQYIEERTSADLAAAQRIFVTGAEYFEIDVEAVIKPEDSSQAGSVEKAAREALENFLHPLRGGPEGKGWGLGRDVYLSDVSAVLERIRGVDYIKELTLMIEAVPQGERVRVAAERIAVAGDIRIKLI